ncbi:MAG: GGDEF domain-containing protein [Candidatus Accumulibacter sp.]|nr:GGDEF domain-containing protein [Accumulibacter sp.]
MMEMTETLDKLFIIDTGALVAVLFWGNFTAAALILALGHTKQGSDDKRRCVHFSLAKFLQASAYFCLFFKDCLPDVVSVNLGNSLLFTGFFLEARSILLLLRDEGKARGISLSAIFLALSLLVFNVIEFRYPDPSTRVATASFCVVFIFMTMNIEIMLLKDSNLFKRMMGVFYAIFTFSMLFRGIHAIGHDMSVPANSPMQSLVFLLLALLLIGGLSFYLLLMKEHSDRLIEFFATTDSLTGISNRRCFLETALRIFERRRWDGTALAIFFADIDNFKTINDRYGHSFGDEVLKTMGGIIKNTLRVQDLYCRYGGEEFVTLLPSSNVEQAERPIARIMAAIKQASFEKHPEFSFTVSIGLMAGVPGPEETLDDFIEKADKAMYQAKTSGKNKVVVYSDGMSRQSGMA